MPVIPVIVPGEWYFVGTCPNCQRMLPLGPAPAPGQHPIVRSWPAEAECDRCGTHTDFQPEQIQRLQAHSSAAGQPSVSFRPESET